MYVVAIQDNHDDEEFRGVDIKSVKEALTAQFVLIGEINNEIAKREGISS